MPLLLAIVGLRFCAPKLAINNRIIVTSVVIVVCLLAFRHLSFEPSLAIEKGMEGIGGGVIGAAVAMLLVSALSKVGAVIALTAIIIVALYICSGGALGRWIVSGLQRLNPAFSKLGSGTKEFFTKSQKEDDDSTSIKVRAKEKESKPALKEAAKLADKRRKKKDTLALHVNDEEAAPAITAEEDENFIESLEQMNTSIVKNDQINKVEQYITSGEQDRSDKSIALKGHEYVLPTEELLEPAEKKIHANKQEIEENARLLKETLGDFGVKGEINNVNVGPTITQYEFKPAPGVRVTKIVNLADDLALSLAASDIRIEAPIPNKSAVGIEVPNEHRRTVKFREVIGSDAFARAESKLSFALGKDISGHAMVADLAKMPHLLIAGATGERLPERADHEHPLQGEAKRGEVHPRRSEEGGAIQLCEHPASFGAGRHRCQEGGGHAEMGGQGNGAPLRRLRRDRFPRPRHLQPALHQGGSHERAGSSV